MSASPYVSPSEKTQRSGQTLDESGIVLGLMRVLTCMQRMGFGVGVLCFLQPNPKSQLLP
jgi:hypothetical protein